MRKTMISVISMILMAFFVFPKNDIKKKFKIELIGGVAVISPDDLNSRIELEKQYMEFFYVDTYTFAENRGYIESLEKVQNGEFNRLKRSFPMGLRFKYNVYKQFSLSLGIKYVSGFRDSNVEYHFRAGLENGSEISEIIRYTPMTLSVKGIIPMIGINYEHKLSKTLGIEIFVNGGPLFGSFKMDIQKKYYDISNHITLSESDYYLLGKGKGTGYFFDGGIRLCVYIWKNINLIFEGSYAFQKVNHLSGPGESGYGGNTDTWEGEWGFKHYEMSRLWGSFEISYPSNSWEGDDIKQWIRNFILDLSGFQASVGVAFRF